MNIARYYDRLFANQWMMKPESFTALMCALRVIDSMKGADDMTPFSLSLMSAVLPTPQAKPAYTLDSNGVATVQMHGTMALFSLIASLLFTVSNGLASNRNSGLIVLSSSYGTDATCSSYSLKSVVYTPVGACYPMSNSGSAIFTTDGGSTVFADIWRYSATCSGKADTETVQITGQSNYYVPLTCTLSQGVYISTYYYAADISVAAGSSPAGLVQSAGLYTSGTCAGQPYSVTLTQYNPTSTVPASCTAAACASYNGGAYVTTYSSTTCFAASAGTAATVSAAGYAYTAQYTGLTCALNQVPTAVNQFAVNTCTPYAASIGATYGGVAARGYARQLFTYQRGVANGAPVYATVLGEGFFSSAACDSTLLYAVYYRINAAAPACTTDGTNQIVWYSALPFTAVPSSVWPAFGTSVSSLSALNNAMYMTASYWGSQGACQAPGVSVPVWVAYTFPTAATFASTGCSPVTSTTYPSLSYTAACTAAATTAASSTNSFAIATFYVSPTCSGSPVGVTSYQLNTCWKASATTSMSVTSPAGLTGNPPYTIKTFAGTTCAGVATATQAQQISCTASTLRPGLYQTVTLSQTATTPTTANGQLLSLTYYAYVWCMACMMHLRPPDPFFMSFSPSTTLPSRAALLYPRRRGYTTQASCTAASAAALVTLTGVSSACLDYTVPAPNPSPTSTPTTFVVSNAVSGCASAAGVAPTASPVAPSAPNMFQTPIFPTSPPNGAANATKTSTSACFAASERVALESGATKAMSEVAVGDRILTVNAKTGAQVYSAVVAVPHGKNAVKATFAVVTTASGRDLKVTANHMLPAGACDAAAASLPLAAAATVAVGDCVQTVSGREQVVSVRTVEGEGIYTAVAMEELLVVNGIVATPFGGVNPALAHLFYDLHRLFFAVAGTAALAAQRTADSTWSLLTALAST